MDIEVVYKEDDNGFDYNQSNSKATIIMDKSDTSIQIYTNRQTPDGIYVRYNDYIIITGKVIDNSGENVKYGKVQFYNNNQPIGEPQLLNSDGIVSLKYYPKIKGILSASYIGNKYFNESFSNNRLYNMKNINTDIDLLINNKTPQELQTSPLYIDKRTNIKLKATVKQEQTSIIKDTDANTGKEIDIEQNNLSVLNKGTVTFLSYSTLDGEGKIIGQPITVNDDGIAELEYSPIQLYDDPQTTEYIGAIYNYNNKFKYYNSSYSFGNITIVKDAQPYISVNPLYNYGDELIKLNFDIRDSTLKTITDTGVLKIYVDNKLINGEESQTSYQWSGVRSLDLSGDEWPLGKHNVYITYKGTLYDGTEVTSNIVTFYTIKKIVNITPKINIRKYDSVVYPSPYILEASVDQSGLNGEDMYFFINNGSLVKSSKIVNSKASFVFNSNPGDYTFYAKVGLKKISNKNAEYTYNESQSSVSTFSIFSGVKLEINPNIIRNQWRGSIKPIASVINGYGSGILYIQVNDNINYTHDKSIELDCNNLKPGTYTIKAWTDGGNFGKGQQSIASTDVTINKQNPILGGWTEAIQTVDWTNAPLWVRLDDLYHEGFMYTGNEEFCFEIHQDGHDEFIKYYNNKSPEYYINRFAVPDTKKYSGTIDIIQKDNCIYANLPTNLHKGNYKITYSFSNSDYYTSQKYSNYSLKRILRQTEFTINDAGCHYPNKVASQGTDSFIIKLLASKESQAKEYITYGINNAQVIIEFKSGDGSVKYALNTVNGYATYNAINFKKSSNLIYANAYYYGNRVYDVDSKGHPTTYAEKANGDNLPCQFYTDCHYIDSVGFKR
jgi:hypothetical protein